MRRAFRLAGCAAALILILVAAFLVLRPSTEPWPHMAERPGPARPGELTLRFLGTSTLLVDDGQDQLMIDGYLSRPGLWTLLTRRLTPDRAAIDRTLQASGIERLSALLVAHTHFDHALDSALLAQRFGARLHGTSSMAAIARAEGRHVAFQPLVSGQAFSVGAFRVTPHAMPHAPGDIADGASAEAFAYPARARDYPMGGNHAFLIEAGDCGILVVPSAGQPGPALADVRADIVLLGIGQLAAQGEDGTTAYWRDTVEASEVGLVIPIHWDDFTRPLARPLRPLPYALDRFDVTMKRLSRLAEGQVALRLPLSMAAMDLSDLPVGDCA